VRIFFIDILTFNGLFESKSDILNPRWLLTMSDENKEASAQDIMKRTEDLVAANLWKILQVQELLMERRRIDGEDIVGIIELMPNGPVIQEDAS
jgi:hypothetical protein